MCRMLGSKQSYHHIDTLRQSGQELLPCGQWGAGLPENPKCYSLHCTVAEDGPSPPRPVEQLLQSTSGQGFE